MMDMARTQADTFAGGSIAAPVSGGIVVSDFIYQDQCIAARFEVSGSECVDPEVFDFATLEVQFNHMFINGFISVDVNPARQSLALVVPS